MRKIKSFLFPFLLINALIASGQSRINRAHFFEEDKPVIMDLSTDLKRLVTSKKANDYQPANVTLHFPDSSVISAPIKLSARGIFRRENCYVPSIKLDFTDTTASSKLSSLKKLKLVVGCGTKSEDEKLLLKEFLVYKIYNLLTDMSFRVRMLRINYTDTRGKIRSYTQYGFLIEDVDDMAKRNKCKEVQKRVFPQERTDRQQMTLVAVFQYLIGNTDWAVPAYHNIKLMRPATDSISFPYVVPYDFDFCGVVNAEYATPNENLDIKSVTERLYRGFPRTIEEVQRILDIFRNKKEAIKNLVTNFEWLDQRNRRDVMKYLDDFYSIIEDKYQVQRIFITDARRD
jgi:hypothetical protein